MAEELLKELVLSNVKQDLDIEDELQDTILLSLIRKVMDHFKFEYGQQTVEERFSFIVEDCVIKRYNRRRAEGATTVSVEGHTVTYEDKYEFSPYHDKLSDEFGDKQKNKITPGRVMVL